MRKSRVLRYRFVLVVISNMLCLHAAAQQHFRYKAALDTVQQDGFYRISLTPAIVARCQPALDDVRIKDKNGSDIPYIIHYQSEPSALSYVLLFPLVKTSKPGKVVLLNNSETGTDHLVLSIKNAAATRTVTLSGSDDAVNWFVIKENIKLAMDNNASEKTSFNQTIQFPYSFYHYFQISTQGKDSLLPLNIYEGGVYRTSSPPYKIFDTIPQPIIVQHDSSDKRSYITFRFHDNYQLYKFQFSLKGAKFFNRSYILYNYNHKDDAALGSGNITSGDSSITLNLHVKTNALLLVINNLDNAPLQLNKAAAYQLPVALLTYLNAGNQYSIFFGDSTLQAPAYDLQYFKDSIHADAYPLAVRRLEQLPVSSGTKSNTNNHLPAAALWSIIIAVLLLLIYFSYTLLKDINKTTNTDVHL